IVGVEGGVGPQLVLGLRRKLESGRHDPDHCEALPVERERFADKTGVRAKTSPPHALAQDDGARAAMRVFFGKKSAAQSRRHAEQRKEVGGDPESKNSLRLGAARQSKSLRPESGHPLEDAVLILVVEELRGRDRDLIRAQLRKVLPDLYEP